MLCICQEQCQLFLSARAEHYSRGHSLRLRFCSSTFVPVGAGILAGLRRDFSWPSLRLRLVRAHPRAAERRRRSCA
jgi:hypothetical protein